MKSISDVRFKIHKTPAPFYIWPPDNQISTIGFDSSILYFLREADRSGHLDAVVFSDNTYVEVFGGPSDRGRDFFVHYSGFIYRLTTSGSSALVETIEKIARVDVIDDEGNEALVDLRTTRLQKEAVARAEADPLWGSW